tara:strand:- start:123 stop:812 length:690 start_codon:yes stop_codon:yes gene_type:complete
MNILTVTSYNKSLEKAYAYRFKKTYNWPFKLKVYNEDIDMFDKIPNCHAFVERNKNKHKYTSYEEKNNDYRTDGVRFCYKVYAYTHAILNEDADGIIGIDADSIFYKPIDVDWIKKHIHRDDCMMTYLGRPNYSECGFLYFNKLHPLTKEFAMEMQDMYNHDLIYEEKEQHDSYIWDVVRKRFEARGVKNHNIGDDKTGHVQARSVLGPIYDHTKGNRKLSGKSPEARV